MLVRAIAFLVLSAVPALAEAICDPDKGTPFTVVGVAADDVLNMRSAPGSSNPVVSSIGPGEKGLTSTGRASRAIGQCETTCAGAEGGLNDTGRSIAYGCKAEGKIWYEVRRANGAVGWASGRYLDLAASGPVVAVPPIAELPEVEARLGYACGAAGALSLVINRGGGSANVTIGGTPYLVLRRDHLLLPYSFEAGDGARLRGGPNIVEWRWPNGRKVNCGRSTP